MVKLQKEVKLDIVSATNKYLRHNQVTVADLTEKSGIKPHYVTAMLKGELYVFTENCLLPIGDHQYKKLADLVGYKIEKSKLKLVQTIQYRQMMSYLREAKRYTRYLVLIGETRCGKTYSIEQFCITHPNHTYVITVSALYKLRDIIDEILLVLRLPLKGSKQEKMSRIIMKLRELKVSGADAILILDESENLEVPVIRMLKGLYDGIKNHASLVLVGTEELITKMEKLKEKRVSGMPQFYSRFKAGIRRLSPINGKFDGFMKPYVEDKKLRKLLYDICDNYGELTSYLEPALQEAERLGCPLTVDHFRLMYNLPIFKNN